MNVEIVLELLLSIWLGALIWMERWIKLKPTFVSTNKSISFWWIRTYALISFFWAISAWIGSIYKSELLIITSFIILWLFILSYFIFSIYKEKQYWITSELAGLTTFFLWVFVMIGYSQIAIILTIILTFILSSKPFIEKLIQKISKDELNNTIKFAIISIVILPLFPDEKFSIANLLSFIWYTKEINIDIINLQFLNPYWIWFFVVLMAGISYAGYVMSKLIWEKWSILASGAIWWLISSTAVAAAMTEASNKDQKNIDLYVVSTLLASTIMFIRVVILVLFFNINMIWYIIYPAFFMLVWMVLYMVYFYLKWRKKAEIANKVSFEENNYSSPFSVGPALKFAWFVLIIKFISWVGWLYQEVWWDYFFYILWVISWLADVDAISQTMAVDSFDWRVGLKIAAITIIIAIFSNNFVKWSIAFKFWEKKFWYSVMLWFIISMIMWIIWILFLNFIS